MLILLLIENLGAYSWGGVANLFGVRKPCLASHLSMTADLYQMSTMSFQIVAVVEHKHPKSQARIINYEIQNIVVRRTLFFQSNFYEIYHVSIFQE